MPTVLLALGIQLGSLIVTGGREQLTITEDLLPGLRFFSPENLFSWGAAIFEYSGGELELVCTDAGDD